MNRARLSIGVDVLRCVHMIPLNMDREMAERATVTFHTTADVKARLERLASATRRSKSFLTNDAVERYLAQEEAFLAAVDAGIADAEAGRVVSHDSAMRYLRSLTSATPLPAPFDTQK